MTNKFKAGDRVRCLSDSFDTYSFGAKGDLGTVKENGRISLDKHRPGENAKIMSPRRFEVVSEPASATFKAGDKVRVVRTVPGLGSLKQGGIYTVEKTSPNGKLVKVAGHGSYYGIERFELVVEEAPKAASKAAFKVGDRVVGIGQETGRSIDGCHGTVKNITTDPSRPLVEFDAPFKGHGASDRDWYVASTRLRHAPVVASTSTVSEALGGSFTGAYRTRDVVKKWIIAVLDSRGRPQPSTTPAVYSSEKQAETVAQEMAKKHPGETFMVFQGTAVASVPAAVVPALVRL